MNEKTRRYLVAGGVIKGPYPTKKKRFEALKLQITREYRRVLDECIDNRQTGS